MRLRFALLAPVSRSRPTSLGFGNFISGLTAGAGNLWDGSNFNGGGKNGTVAVLVLNGGGHCEGKVDPGVNIIYELGKAASLKVCKSVNELADRDKNGYTSSADSSLGTVLLIVLDTVHLDPG